MVKAKNNQAVPADQKPDPNDEASSSSKNQPK
jgi:hypothetical protein